MADAAVSYVIEGVISRLISLATEQIKLSWGLEKDLEKFKNSLIAIKSVLRDAEEKQATGNAVMLWLQGLKEIAQEADDVLDELAHEDLRKQVKSRRQSEKQVLRFYLLPEIPVLFRLRIARKIKRINEFLQGLSTRTLSLGLTALGSTDIIVNRIDDEITGKTHSFLDCEVVERGNDVSEIMDVLRNNLSSERAISVVSIVGMAGLGKTTIAKSICRVAEEEKLFDARMWVCVSYSFNELTILGGMLESMDKNAGGLRNVDAILRHLKVQLEKKKFLLVLDDVWNEEHSKWEFLKSSLLGVVTTNGNSIVVTTRNERVASVMETFPRRRHYPDRLSVRNCWDIIKNKIFMNRNEIVHSKLEKIGMEIAGRCGGLPLVANVLGGTMSREMTEEMWILIRDSNTWDALKKDNILPILRISYDHLPSFLKQCFGYCSIFPKDFDIQKDQLVQLWMAEGFLQPHEGGSSYLMEEIGDKYFNILLSNSLFQDVEKDDYNNIIFCKMHHVVHDLALIVSKGETLNLEMDHAVGICHQNEQITPVRDLSCVRHMNLGGDGVLLPATTEAIVPKLHTLVTKTNLFCVTIGGLKSLRTLIISGAEFEELPPSIGNLKHLRFLDVSNTGIKSLPPSITKLYHLQTLKLKYCNSLTCLPWRLIDLINLRHLYFTRESQMPARIGQLIHLQTLPLFVVGAEKGHGMQELGCLSRLRGELRICRLEHVRDEEDAKTAELKRKTKLHDLTLEWSVIEDERSTKNDESVLAGLEPHRELRGLKIENYGGERFPPWMWKNIDGSLLLHNLVDLKLIHCEKCKRIPTLGHLPSLRFLEISEMFELDRIGSEFYSNDRDERGGESITIFPSLQKFYLSYMNCLEEWAEITTEDGVSVFPCLKELLIRYCEKLKGVPIRSEFPSLQRLEIWDCDELRSIGEGLSSSTSLRELVIWRCPKLVSVPSIDRLSLEELEIRDCSNLRCIPEDSLRSCFRLKRLNLGPFSEELEEFPSLNFTQNLQNSLEILDLNGWEKVKSLPHQIQLLKSLRELGLQGFNGVEAFPGSSGNNLSLSSLHILRVHNCSRLLHLPSLPSLTELKYWDCHKEANLLSEETVNRFPCLKRLDLRVSTNSEEFPGLDFIHHLHESLEELTLSGSKKLKCLPHQLQYLTCLKVLEIRGFSGMDSLPEWLRKLSSLRRLKVSFCGDLKYLPSKEAMESLSCLKELTFNECPKLKERCEKNIGSEWLKISHIPTIVIDFVTL